MRAGVWVGELNIIIREKKTLLKFGPFFLFLLPFPYFFLLSSMDLFLFLFVMFV